MSAKFIRYIFFLYFIDFFDLKIILNESFSNFQDPAKWAEMCIHNIASSGKFSSDRTICDYATEIWGVKPSWEKLPSPHDIVS